jgi:hypothetical protein
MCERRLTRDARLDVLQPDDVKNRTPNDPIGNAIGIQVYSEIYRIPFDQRQVSVAHIVMAPVAEVNPERSEGIFCNKISNLLFRNHA